MLKLRTFRFIGRSIPHTTLRVLACCAVGLFATPNYATTPAADAKTDAHGIEFFEAKIRPVLVEKCYSCHSADAKALRGGLLLDTKQGVLTGGDSGPSIEPGKPDESLLIQALKFDGFEMPPSGKLSAQVIKDFEHWVKIGAPDPRTATTAVAKKGIDLEAGRKFWSFAPIGHPQAPKVADNRWATSDIDRFILAKLEAKKLHPVADADRSTWLRRVTFDLIGLPPSPAELDAFLADKSPNAYATVVDRLLASPQFGERWGRHWLDVARFAESSGGGRSMVFKEAWRYRDYVIDSFNADKPFDRFVAEQIAGDLLPHETPDVEREHLVATSYLVLGATNYEEQDKRVLEMDVADEQIEAVGKGLLGMTIGCARCHDHKFDPIPTRDYYALAGILRNCQLLEHENVSKWVQAPLPLPAEEEAVFAEHAAAVAALEAELKDTGAQLVKLGGGPRKTPDILAASELPGVVVDDRQAKKVGRWTESRSVKPYIGDGYVYDDVADKGSCTITFDPELPETGRYEVRLAYTAHGNRSRRVPVTVFSAEGEKTIAVNMQEAPTIEGRFVSLGEYRFEVGGQSFVMIDSADTQGHVVADAVQFLPRGDEPAAPPAVAEQDQVASTAAPNDIAAAEQLATLQAQIKQLEKQLKQLRASGPQHPEVMTVRERAEIHDLPVHVRGSVHSLGELVPRGFLQVVSPAAAGPLPSSQSGRRELADWLASPENPLTARVYVNRVWYWLLGEGLVRSVDNFGSTGETPSHAELLDHLALRLIDEGWSTKSLVRYVVLSQTYRQASASREDGVTADPENRLLWRANRRRLEAECLRDAMLAVSGQLSDEIGGPTIKPGTANDYGYVASSVRRSVYLPVLRNSLPEIFEVFDFPDPSLVAGRRNTSTVAPQALFFMNSPLVREQALSAADRLLAEQLPDDEARITQAFRHTLGRAPSDAERAIARELVARSDAVSPDQERRPWSQLFHLLFSSLDFRYRD